MEKMHPHGAPQPGGEGRPSGNADPQAHSEDPRPDSVGAPLDGEGPPPDGDGAPPDREEPPPFGRSWRVLGRDLLQLPRADEIADAELTRSLMRLSEPAFTRVWDNDDDSVYDEL